MLTLVDFMGKVIEIKFAWECKPNNHITVHMIQEIFADNLIEEAGLTEANPVKIPYISGHTVDNIPTEKHPSLVQPTIKNTL